MPLHESSYGTPAVELIERKLLIATAPIDFQNIPPRFTHLKLIGSVRDPSANVHVGLRFRFNNDSGNNYSSSHGELDATSFTGITDITSSYILFGRVLANSVSIDAFTVFELTIPDYTNPDHFKSCVGLFQGSDADTSAGQMIGYGGGVWRASTAINRILVWSDIGAGDFSAESCVSLYGYL